jgi:death-on-curing protein
VSEPIWLSVEDVVALHGEQLAIFGGPPGIRDQGMFESALGRPQNKFAYGESDLAALAAAYAYGIARNQPFIDGNKRAAFAAMMVFLRINGIAFAPDVGVVTAAMIALAAGEIEEDAFARWIRDYWPT